MKILIPTAVVTLFAASAAHAQQAVQWKVADGGNGHWYQVVVLPGGVSWTDAKARAELVGGHLATISGGQENQFCFGLVHSEHPAWSGTPDSCDTCCGCGGPWLGGYQDLSAPDYSEPTGGWRWIDGTAWSFSGWYQPVTDDGNGNPEAFLQFWRHFLPGMWNDNENLSNRSTSYVVEFDADCNNDGIVDYGQILDGTFPDSNNNGIPDCCESGASCAADPISAGLQAYLKFDGDCVDSSVFGRNGAPTGIQFTQDRFNAPGKAAQFDGVATDVQVQGIPIPSNNAFSWALWLRIEPMPYGISGVPILQRIESVGNNLMSPSLWLRADGRISFVSYMIGPGGWDLDTPSEAVVPGDWVHVACTSAASGDRRIYLGGALVAQGVAPNYGQELGLLLIGRDRLDSNPRLRAAIDELRVYDRTLSAAEVVVVRDIGGPADPTCVDADLYRDFNVNGADLGIMLSQWGPNTPLTESDLNNDGVVNGADLGLLLYFWGACP